MKKALSVLLAALLLLTALCALTACEKKEAAPAQEPTIVGMWKNDTTIPGAEFIYTFREDGSGQYDAAGTVMPFKYTIDGSKISILFDGDTVSFDTEFAINGKELNVKDSSGNDTIYQRVEGAADTAEKTDAAPLKDNPEEAEKQIQIAFRKWIDEAYGDSVTDAKITVQKIYSTEEEQATEVLKEYKLGPNEVAFEVQYELLPKEGVDTIALTAATGVFDAESGWIKEKFNLGILRPSADAENGYVVTDVGTGW